MGILPFIFIFAFQSFSTSSYFSLYHGDFTARFIYRYKFLFLMKEPEKPSFKEFYEFFMINPRGNAEKTYREVCFHIAGYVTLKGENVTWNLLKEKYRQYLSMCKSESTNERYIKTLYSFIKERDYCNIFEVRSQLGFLDKLYKEQAD